jgi:hypothetical protein
MNNPGQQPGEEHHNIPFSAEGAEYLFQQIFFHPLQGCEVVVASQPPGCGPGLFILSRLRGCQTFKLARADQDYSLICHFYLIINDDPAL